MKTHHPCTQSASSETTYNIAVPSTTMSHTAGAEGYEDEITEEEDEFDNINGPGRPIITTDDYIESAFSPPKPPHHRQLTK